VKAVLSDRNKSAGAPVPTLNDRPWPMADTWRSSNPRRALWHSGGMDPKPFAPACERNRDPILAVLRRHFADCRSVLEVGSGTGQHAVHFAAALPWLSWQCADLEPQLPGIRQWLDEAGLPNTLPPLALDVRGPWPKGPYDAVFSANILHIVGWPEVEAFFAGVGRVLGAAGTLVVYGPFNANGIHTSTSNRDFDAWLKARDPRSGIRDAEAVQALAAQAGLQLIDDVEMPANNRCLVWRRS
jgi:SAM-dependent methyltransferase